MGSPARRPGGGLSRKQRVDRSYKLIVATAGFGVGGLVLLIVGFGLWGFLALVVAAVAGFFLKQTLNP
jgi:outer membrane lipoprotein SlyB